ncbi:hypothetical protein BGZ46_009337 [Entomortierella lignicola]|nr:hypothetical protein BGZ46_009337 [Entomortierella lignicola]
MNGGTMQQQQQQHFDAEINEINLAHSYSDDKSGTTFTKKAVLLPFIATTLSPLSSPQTSPITSSTSFTTLGHFQSTSPFFKLSATYSSSKSLATCSSSLYFLSSNLTNTSSSFSSLSSFIDTLASKQQTLRCLSSSDMTVAKLEPSSGDSINSISPPESPLTLKKDVYSSSVSPSATSTTTTTRITSSKNISSTTTDSKRDDSVDNDSAKKPPRKLGPKMNPVYKFLRAFAWAMYFDLGATLISMTQVLSLPLTLIAPGVYYRHIKRTAGHFGAFLLRMNQLFAPSDIILTGDESVKGIIKVYQGKHLKGGKDGEAASKHKADETLLDMPDRLVLISNHQGMRFFDFILLKRNDFEHDKRAIEQNLKRAAKDEPLWLVVFPEGTVVSKGTRKRSQTFAEKAGLTDHRHVLLPRTSGLFICINELRGSVEYVYDTTVGYSGIHYGEIPQELYPLPGLYINKAQPKEINMHLRRFAVKDIPSTEPEFIEWVRARWIEKDELMEVFYKTGKFPSQFTSEDIGGDSSEDTDIKGGVSIRLPLKSRSMLDYLSPSAIVVIALPVIAYAALKYF